MILATALQGGIYCSHHIDENTEIQEYKDSLAQSGFASSPPHRLREWTLVGRQDQDGAKNHPPHLQETPRVFPAPATVFLKLDPPRVTAMKTLLY